MVVIQTPNGSNEDYRLIRTRDNHLRLARSCASYDLATMTAEAGWVIVGIRTEAAKRLLKKAGLLTTDTPLLPLRRRWRTEPSFARSTVTSPIAWLADAAGEA